MKVRKGGGEEKPFIQGKEQRLCFAGTAVRRHPVSEAIGDQQKPPRTRGQGRQLGGATHARGQARGVVAAQSQEGLEELSHVEGQERRR